MRRAVPYFWLELQTQCRATELARECIDFVKPLRHASQDKHVVHVPHPGVTAELFFGKVIEDRQIVVGEILAREVPYWNALAWSSFIGIDDRIKGFE